MIRKIFTALLAMSLLGAVLFAGVEAAKPKAAEAVAFQYIINDKDSTRNLVVYNGLKRIPWITDHETLEPGQASSLGGDIWAFDVPARTRWSLFCKVPGTRIFVKVQGGNNKGDLKKHISNFPPCGVSKVYLRKNPIK